MTFLLWFGVLQVMSWAAAPLLAFVLPRFPDRGYGLARAIGWLLTGYVCWILTAAGGVPSNRWQAWAVLGALVVCAGTPWARRQARRVPGAEVRRVEMIFYGTTLLFLFFRACQPEIFWGEKPMDFTFLNFFIRLEQLPPQDPWAAGHYMQYYYFGTYLIAMLHKLTRLDPGVGYNVALATLAGLFTSCAYSAILAIGRRPRFAIAGALGVLLLADWDVLNIAFFQTEKHGFDLFWASSRIMPPAIANEYPLWSFLFADLHAHLIAMPFSITLVALSLRLLQRDKKRFTVDKGAHLLLLALIWGSLLMINSWDFISYGVVLGVLYAFRPFVEGGRRRRLTRVGTWGLRGAATLGVALLAIAPFLKALDGGGQDNGFQLERYAFYTTPEMLRYLGQFALPALLLAGWVGYRHFNPRWRGRAHRRFAWRSLLVPMLFVEAMWLINLSFKWRGIEQFPWSGALGMTVPVFFGSALWFRRRLPRRLKTIGFLLFSAGILGWLGEFYFVRERMNSLFKLCLPLWTLTGIALAALLPYAWLLVRRSPFFNRRRARPMRWPRLVAQSALRLSVAMMVLAAVLGAGIDMVIMANFQRVEEGPRWTLDGLAYLGRKNPEELALMRYLRDETPGLPRIAEAWGDAYGPYTRISMNTGLPTWLGWEHHVKQRGLAAEEVDRRKRELHDIYTSLDAEETYRTLVSEGIELVVFGTLERNVYGGMGEHKFQDSPRFQSLAHFGNEAVYRVVR